MTSLVEARSRTVWAWVTGTFFGIGMMGKGGGTVASVATVLLWFSLTRLQLSFIGLTSITIMASMVITLIGIPAGTIVARELARKDPSEVVIDEVAGQLIALIAVPVDWKYIIASLILFRGFDIFKPPPVRQLEALPGGTGIMMDDVAAGLYALAIVQTLHHFRVLG